MQALQQQHAHNKITGINITQQMAVNVQYGKENTGWAKNWDTLHDIEVFFNDMRYINSRFTYLLYLHSLKWDKIKIYRLLQ